MAIYATAYFIATSGVLFQQIDDGVGEGHSDRMARQKWDQRKHAMQSEGNAGIDPQPALRRGVDRGFALGPLMSSRIRTTRS